MKAVKFMISEFYKKIPKYSLAVLITGGTACVINHKLRLNGYQVPLIKSVVSAAAATNRLDQIQSFNFIADVVELITPSVVSITVSGPIIGVNFGSGFIVDEAGYILTNAHVVLKNPFVIVTLSDGQKYQGEVTAIDTSSDLALIKINPRVKLHALNFAEMSKLRAGEFVIALGSPMTLSNSVTVGVVSAVERDLGHSKGLKYVQTDAIIAVGNSGGPLVNLYGEVVGVNTMMVTTGFGFAIPSDHCSKFVNLARQKKRPGGPVDGTSNGKKSSTLAKGDNKYIGVVMGSLTPEMVYENRINNPNHIVHPTSGVVIHCVFEMSPAFKIGILPGDIIESVNGFVVHSTAEFTKFISQFDKVDLVLIRRGHRVELKNFVPEIF